MRKIIFRGKRKYGSEWIEGVLLTDNKTVYDILYPEVQADGKLKFRHFEIIPETVGQFTGLTDRNGKEIYEGDIIETELGFWDYELTNKNPTGHDGYSSVVCLCVVEWFNSGLKLKVSVIYSKTSVWGTKYDLVKHFKNKHFDILRIGAIGKLEIIGNIHDNPELLTSNKER